MISTSFFLTPLMTFKAFMPSRITTTEGDCPEVTNLDGGAVLRGQGHGFQVAQRTQIAESPDHVFRAAHFKHSPADFIRAGADFFDDRGKRDSVGAKLVRVQIDLVLLDEPADRRHFRYSRNGFELVAEVPILNAAQVGKTALVAAVHKDVLVDPARPRGVRSNHWMDVRREPSLNLLHVFENPRARPIQIGSVFEDDEDVGIAKHGLRAHGFDVRSGK